MPKITLKCDSTEKMRFDKVKNALKRKSNSDVLRFLVNEAYDNFFEQK